MQPVTGIFDGILVGTLTGGQALDTDAQTFVVHHGEHGRQALVRLAYQITYGFVEVHHAGGGCLDAHLVFDRAAVGRVARAQAAVGIDHELGHQEQRDALGACRRVRQFRQHQVNDVLGEIVFTASDEKFSYR
nr:hypothetical protein GCM10020185_40860 [Pseudomonas brassicacearum subsp. brassicacearum]